MQKQKNIDLPTKPSDLIRLAIDDLTRAEKARQYKINMDQYHQKVPYYDMVKEDYVREKKCSVCFAGAVMAMSGKVNIDDPLDPDHFPSKTQDKLYALNCFRDGDIAEGLEFMGKKRPNWIPEIVDITPYDESPKKFKKDMNELADRLEEFKL